MDVLSRCAALRAASQHYEAFDLAHGELRDGKRGKGLHLEKARALLGLGEALEAQAALAPVFAKFPEDPDALCCLVESEAIIGRRDKIRQALTRLLRSTKRSGKLLYKTAQVLLRCGQPRLAAGCCFALRHLGDEPKLALAGCLLRLKRYRGAWRITKRIRQRRPGYAAAVALAGHIQHENNDMNGSWYTWTSIPISSYRERRVLARLSFAKHLRKNLQGCSIEEIDIQFKRCESGTYPWYSVGEDDLFPPIGKGLIEGSVVVCADSQSMPALRKILIRERLLLPEGKWIGGRRCVLCLGNVFGGRGLGLRLFLFLSLLQGEAARAGGVVAALAGEEDTKMCFPLQFGTFLSGNREMLTRRFPSMFKPHPDGRERFWRRISLFAENARYALFRPWEALAGLWVTASVDYRRPEDIRRVVLGGGEPGKVDMAPGSELIRLGPVREDAGGYFVIKNGMPVFIRLEKAGPAS